MAWENEGWGDTRIKGALQNLGLKVGRGTIQRILRENGIDPTPLRGMSWATFIKAHPGAIVGMDFFTVEAVTWLGLVRYHVLFAINIASRKVEIVGMVANPGGPWMEQMARNLVDAVDGFLVGKRYVLIDRDPLYTEAFRRILGQAGVNAMRLPARSLNLNGVAERFVGSVRREVLDHVIVRDNRASRSACRPVQGVLQQGTTPSGNRPADPRGSRPSPSTSQSPSSPSPFSEGFTTTIGEPRDACVSRRTT